MMSDYVDVDIFWLKVVLSFFVGGGYIAFTVFVSEKFGSKIGWIILGLPSTLLISLIFTAWAQDTQTVVNTLPIIPAGLALSSLFAMFFIMAYGRGLKTAPAIAISLLGWGVLSLILAILKPPLPLSILICLTGIGIAIWYLQKFPHQKLDKIKSSYSIFIYRAVFAGAVIVISVLMNKFMGPIWGGMFAVFPAAFTSSLYFISKEHGFKFVSSVARTMPWGTLGTMTFAISLYFLIGCIGFVPSLIVAYIISVFCAIGIYFLPLK